MGCSSDSGRRACDGDQRRAHCSFRTEPDAGRTCVPGRGAYAPARPSVISRRGA
jgi:hypothetical protein